MWKKRELDQSWEFSDVKLLDGVRLEGRNEQEGLRILRVYIGEISPAILSG